MLSRYGVHQQQAPQPLFSVVQGAQAVLVSKDGVDLFASLLKLFLVQLLSALVTNFDKLVITEAPKVL